MADNTQAKAMGELRNVRIQIDYQSYLVNFLVLDIPVDKELPLLLGRPFLRTCGAVIDIGRGTISTDDGVIRHTYFPKPRAKAYLENFEIDEEDDWISCFNVGRDEDGNPKYGPMAPSFLDIEDEMERALAIEAYFNPFKNIIKATKSLHINPLTAKYEKQKDKGTINYTLQQVTNANLKWQDLPSMERHAYCERLSRLQQKSIRTPRVADWTMFYVYSFDETLKDLMKIEYLHNDGDMYPKWCYVDESIKLEIDDKLFDHDEYCKKVGKLTRTNRRTSLIREPLITLEESRGINLAWIIAEHLCKHVPRLKENSLICGGHYVTNIAKSLGYLVNEEVESV
ncbi:hypothetical protein Tco_0457864 [Tanacetum coccineum]